MVAMRITTNAVEARRNLEGLNEEIPQVTSGQIYTPVFAARNRIARYPSPYFVKGAHHWASERQRRAVMAKIRSGEIRVPYRRTGAYGWNWRVRRSDGAGNLGYTLYNPLDYAPHVGGDEEGGRQYHLHQKRWLVARQEFEDAARNTPERVETAIVAAARRRGL